MADVSDIKVVVRAITETAEQSIEDIGDKIRGTADDSVAAQTTLDQFSDEINEATASAVAGQSALEELSDESRDLALMTEILSEQLEQVGDELSENTAKASANAGAFSALSLGSAGVNLNFGRLSATTVAALIPALAALSTVLAPLAVAFGTIAAAVAGLAAAFGLVIGSGILAHGQNLAEQNKEQLEGINKQVAALKEKKQVRGALTQQERQRLSQLEERKKKLEDASTATGALAKEMKELGKTAKDALADFGQDFAPLIGDAIDALPALGAAVLDSVGGLESFKNALRDFGQLAAEVIPKITGLLFDLARAALPILRDFVNFLTEKGGGALDAMGQSMNALSDEASGLLDALIEFAPTMLKFGTALLEVIIPGVTRFITILDKVLQRILNPTEGGFIQGLGEAVEKVKPGLNDLFSSFVDILPELSKFAGNIVKIAGDIGEALLPVISDLVELIGKMVGRINESEAMSEFGSTLQDWLPILTKAGKQLVELGGIVFDTVFPAIEVLVLAVSEFLQAIEPVARFIVNDLNPALLDFFDAVQRRVAVGARVMKDFVDKADAGFKVIGDAIKTAIEVYDDFESAFNQALNAIEAKIKDVIIDFAGDAWDIFVEDVTEVKKGVEQDINALIGFFQDLEKDAIDALEPVIDFIEDLQEAVNDVVRRLNQFEGVDLPQLDSIPDVEGDGEGGGGIIGKIGKAFEGDTAEGKKLEDVASTFGGTLGAGGLAATRVAKDRFDQRERNQVNVDSVKVDATGSELGDNPRRDSRTIAEQIAREFREIAGTNP